MNKQSLEMFHFSAAKINLPKHRRCMRSLSRIHIRSTETRNCKDLHPHRHVYAQMCPGTYIHKNALEVFTLIHTHSHTCTLRFESHRGRSQQRAGYCQMVCVCNVCDYHLSVFDLQCRLASAVCLHLLCVFLCVYVWVISPALFFMSATIGLFPELQAKDVVYHQRWLCTKKCLNLWIFKYPKNILNCSKMCEDCALFWKKRSDFLPTNFEIISCSAVVLCVIAAF